MTDLPVVRDNTDFLRRRTEAQVSAAQADVDRIEADLATARTRLKWAQRALDTVDNVNETVSDLQDAARDALGLRRGGQCPVSRCGAGSAGVRRWRPARSPEHVTTALAPGPRAAQVAADGRELVPGDPDRVERLDVLCQAVVGRLVLGHEAAEQPVPDDQNPP